MNIIESEGTIISELLIPLDELSFIDDLFTKVYNGLKRNSTTDILNKFNL